GRPGRRGEERILAVACALAATAPPLALSRPQDCALHAGPSSISMKASLQSLVKGCLSCARNTRPSSLDSLQTRVSPFFTFDRRSRAERINRADTMADT